MLRKSVHKLNDVKVFSKNHKKHELILKSFGKKSGVEFKAKLSEDELKKLIELIEENMFKDI